MWFFILKKNLSGFLFWKNYYVVFLIGMNDMLEAFQRIIIIENFISDFLKNFARFFEVFRENLKFRIFL
jgi:hypothetical protein